jgi:uncharacterized protein
MKSVVSKMVIGIAFLGMLTGVSATAIAADATKSSAPAKHHNVVFQVSDNNEAMYEIALNNMVNLQKEMGMDNVTMELVAYGPGLKILMKDSPVSERVKSLALQNMTFSACANTMKGIEKKTGKKVELTEGVGVVPGGIIRIMELQDAGWNYIRP